MAWYLNLYRCYRCDADGPINGRACATTNARIAALGICRPTTARIWRDSEHDGKEFVVFRSPDTAEHDPAYREVRRFPSREKALEFLSADG